MKMVPLFRCSNMKEAIWFYTTILDFELAEPGASSEDSVVLLSNGEAELMLTRLEGDQKAAINAVVRVNNIDEVFHKYKQRGLPDSDKPDSPVHKGPIDQSWGTREFYVTDKDGNTLRFFQPLT